MKCTRNTREDRALQGYRLKVMLADLGLTPETAANILHVTPRTVQHWISGRTRIPYAAYRLLRIMRGGELADPTWQGWHMHSGKLWSPEGHGFDPRDSSWWSLLVRQARCFRALYQRSAAFDRALMMLGADGLRASDEPLSGEAGRTAGTSRASLSSHEPALPDVPTGEAGRTPQAAGLNLSLGHFRTRGEKNLDLAPSGAIKSVAKGSIKVRGH